MTHGFWSMFQTAGWNNDTWLPRLKAIGNWWATIVVALFIVQAVVFTVNAHADVNYANCPALVERYGQFAAEGKNQLVSPASASRIPAAAARNLSPLAAIN